MKNNKSSLGFVGLMIMALSSNAAFAQSEPGQLTPSPLNFGSASGISSSSRAALQKFYADRNNEPLFVRGGQLTALVGELKQAISVIAPKHGLSIKDYWTTDLELMSVLPTAPENAELAFAKA
ncbi:MAG: hypothetical protein EOP06_31555, partial [Proteobacteria bacterium]